MQRVIDPSKVGLGYNGNSQVKRDGISQNFTAHEIGEYKRCIADPAYFARTYCRVINLDRGLVPFDLYPYQEKMFRHFSDNRFSIVLACRQSGKSLSVVMWLLHYAIFNPDKTIAILANKGATAREMLARITLALEYLPFFIQPGCKTLNKGSITFSNNSRIIAASTTGNSIRGMSVDVLALDEFAFINDADTFYTSTYPVISSGKKSKVIITSTINGVGNLFYRLWQGALQAVNDFKPFRVDWYDVPGRDEAWRRQTIANTSELQFAQEYGNQAIGSTDTLITGDALLALKASEPIRHHDSGNLKIYHEPAVGHSYVMMADVARGRGQDYSTATIIDMTSRPFCQVASYRDNMISPLMLPDVLVKMAKRYNNALLIIENNDAGLLVCNAVYHELEYENTFVESTVKSGGIGVTMTKRVKRTGCSNLKDLIEARKLEILDLHTIQELTTFESNGESYAAADGCHDDLAMNLVLFAWFLSTPFAELGDNAFKEMLFAEKLKAMEDDMVPPGVFHSDPEDKPESSRIYEDMVAREQAWATL